MKEPRWHSKPLRLRKPIEAAVAAGHPWIYRDALHALDVTPGTLVRVDGVRGEALAVGYAEAGPIAVKVLALASDSEPGAELWSARVDAALELRRRIITQDTSAFRLVNGEGDRLPGFVCDVYDRYAVVQCDGEGAVALRDVFVEALRPALRALGVATLLHKRKRRAGAGSGVESASTPKVETLFGDAPAHPIAVTELGMKLVCDLMHGQKTGLFLDHRRSRRRVRELAHGLRVLNLYGYTGGFSVAAALGGAADVVTVDSAPAALDMAQQTFRANSGLRTPHRTAVSDVEQFLKQSQRKQQKFDLVVADPPNFAPNEAARGQALRAYEGLHRGVLSVLAPRGLYLAASCSSHIGYGDFQQSLYDAARKSGRQLQLLDRWGAAEDHTRLLAFPEGDYLKCLLLRAAD